MPRTEKSPRKRVAFEQKENVKTVPETPCMKPPNTKNRQSSLRQNGLQLISSDLYSSLLVECYLSNVEVVWILATAVFTDISFSRTCILIKKMNSRLVAYSRIHFWSYVLFRLFPEINLSTIKISFFFVISSSSVKHPYKIFDKPKSCQKNTRTEWHHNSWASLKFVPDWGRWTKLRDLWKIGSRWF